VTTLVRGDLSVASAESMRDGFVAECMQSLGWDYVPTVFIGEEEPSDVATSVDFRRTHGYTNPSATNPDPSRPRGGIALSSGAAAEKFNRDYNGSVSESSNPEGCVGRASVLLEQKVPKENRDLAMGWSGPTMQETLADPRVVGAYTQWRSCLAKRGIEVPESALDARSDDAGPETAVADAECYLENVAPTLNEVERGYLPDFLDRYPQYTSLVKQVLKESGHTLT